jgi:O-antigen ligase
MLPVFLPTAMMLGRALGNVLFFSYLLWALLSLRPRDWVMPAPLGFIYSILVGVFLLGVMVAGKPDEVLHTWFRWAAYTLVLPITLSVLARQTLDEARLLRWSGIAAGVALFGFLVLLLKAEWQGAHVARTINGMALAYMLPFLIAWLRNEYTLGVVRLLVPLLVIMGFTGLVFADSSTEVLAASIGLLVMLMFHLRNGVRILWVALLLIFGVLTIELVPKLSQLHSTDWLKILDVWSSRRSTMWIDAINYPPENFWLGVGMGNAQYSIPLLNAEVKSFHNFLFDAWYETGVLGLGVLLALLWLLFQPVLRGLRMASDELKMRCAPWMAGVVAILVVASLDHSYGSVSFAMLMLFELAVLRTLLLPAAQNVAAPGSPQHAA